MCTTCGCRSGVMRIGGKRRQPRHKLEGTTPYRATANQTADARSTASANHPIHSHDLIDFGSGVAETHVPGMRQSRIVKIERDILAKNNHYADANRRYLTEHGIFALNLVSSPGSGKTTLLVQTIAALPAVQPIYVIEGDQQTENDALRIRATGARALQINTGKGCHLDADMVGRAVQQLNPQESSLLFIENVGNLVCPASFDLGEAHKVVVLSITEGEDKPLKYPDMFRAADLMILNKCDLMPYLAYDLELAIDYAHRINPTLQVIQLSAVTGEGMPAWLAWIKAGHRRMQAAKSKLKDWPPHGE
ncbi:MAG TPA: hydrogenase accessory protein HypB [Nitrosomonas nitrosa]|nr:hydrogenase accessory protein HypB [Nitrosomonas nitrosa]HNP51759.1 hydrogenase nickel incorporation protein HypB [Nitrosomonas nitrosa]